MSRSIATASPVSMLLEQTRAEFLRYLRSPILSVFTLALPVVFYLFVGLSYTGVTIAGVPGPVYALAGFAAYAVSNVMLSTFGIGLTVDRARRMDVLMRATPLRPWVRFVRPPPPPATTIRSARLHRKALHPAGSIRTSEDPPPPPPLPPLKGLLPPGPPFASPGPP